MNKKEFILFIKNNVVSNNSVDNHLKYRDDYQFIYENIFKFTNSDFITLNEKIYSLVHNLNKRPICACGNNLKFISFKKGFNKSCSKKCAHRSKDRIIKTKQTKKEKYGDENFVNPEKAKQTMLSKYGVEHTSVLSSVKEKYRHTMNERYGVDNSLELTDVNKRNEILRLPSTIDKRKQTNKKNHGVEFSFLTKESFDKAKKTMFERYGSDNPMNSNNIVDKNKETLRISTYNKYNNLENVKPLFNQDEFVNTNYLNRYLWLCKKCNIEFEDDVYSGRMPRCPSCFPKHQPTSNLEKEIVNYIKFLGVKNIIENNRNILSGKELDIYLPDYNLAIEFNGLYWHSELNGKHKTYHLNKTKMCKEKEIQLIHIFEDEWVNKQEIIKNIISIKLGLVNKIYGRKCTIKELKSKDCKDFLNENHIQGYVPAKINIGLYHEDDLVSLLTLGKSRFNKNYDWEILRYVNKTNTSVIGGFSKLLKYFLTHYSGSIVTYSDARLFDGGVYKNNGFKELSMSSPAYFYVKGVNRFNRQQFQKHKLKNKLELFDSNLTEWENMQLNGWDRIWDCGNYAFELRR